MTRRWMLPFAGIPGGGEAAPAICRFRTSLSSKACEGACEVILFPAIDLKDGQCVRLKLGDMDQATVFNADPAAQARAFEDAGL